MLSKSFWVFVLTPVFCTDDYMAWNMKSVVIQLNELFMAERIVGTQRFGMKMGLKAWWSMVLLFFRALDSFCDLE